MSIPNQRQLEDLKTREPEVEFVFWDMSGPAPREHFDIVVPPYMGQTSALGNLKSTTAKLVQSQSIGYDGVAEALPPGFKFANAATVHEPSTAELALALILSAQRGIPRFVRSGDLHKWDPYRFESLADRKVLIVGYGGVGKATAARLEPFEVEIRKVATRARTENGEEIYGLDSLHELLGWAEIVVLGMPLNENTEGMVDSKFLAAMQDGALLVNVARGKVLDQDALISELNSGRLRAALDVTEPEPLPEDHPLWDCPNLLITPHVGGASSTMFPRMRGLILRQIQHLKNGEALENIVLES